MAGNVGYAACQCAVLVVLAKLGSPEDVGRFALALALSAPVMIAASLQLRVVQATDARGDHPFGAYLGLRLVTTAVALAVVAAVAFGTGHPARTIALVLLMALAKAFEAVSDVIFGRLQRSDDLRRIALSMIAKGALSVLGMAFMLAVTGDVVLGTLALALVWAGWLLAYDLPAARRLGSVRPTFAWRALAPLAWLALPMGLVAGLQSLMTNVPRYAIEAHAGPRALGYFAALAYLVLAGNQPVMALWAAFSPRLARLFLADRPAYHRLTRRALAIALGMGVLTVGGAAAIGAPLLAVVYAPDYAAQAPVLVWLAVVAAVGYVTSALCSSITAARRFPEQLLVIGVTLLVSWIGSTILVPRYGLVGAAWALLAATLVQTACLAAVYLRLGAAPSRVCRAGAAPAPARVGTATAGAA